MLLSDKTTTFVRITWQLVLHCKAIAGMEADPRVAINPLRSAKSTSRVLKTVTNDIAHTATIHTSPAPEIEQWAKPTRSSLCLD
jgi:hypothetical protein